MVKITARGVKILYDEKTMVSVFFKVGNCSISDGEIQTLLRLQTVCRANPVETIDCRTANVKMPKKKKQNKD